MKAIVLGEEESALGFSLIGVEGRIAGDAVEAALELRRILDSRDPSLLFVTETVAGWIASKVAAAVARGALIQVIAGPCTPVGSSARDPEAELLSALGVKL
jgi:vacuolar-type H+-ATPase subunit F/Vma7